MSNISEKEDETKKVEISNENDQLQKTAELDVKDKLIEKEIKIESFKTENDANPFQSNNEITRTFYQKNKKMQKRNVYSNIQKFDQIPTNLKQSLSQPNLSDVNKIQKTNSPSSNKFPIKHSQINLKNQFDKPRYDLTPGNSRNQILDQDTQRESGLAFIDQLVQDAKNINNSAGSVKRTNNSSQEYLITQDSNGAPKTYKSGSPAKYHVGQQSDDDSTEPRRFAIKISKPDHLMTNSNPITHVQSNLKLKERNDNSQLISMLQQPNLQSNTDSAVSFINQRSEIRRSRQNSSSPSEVAQLRTEQKNQFEVFADKIKQFKMEALQIQSETSQLYNENKERNQNREKTDFPIFKQGPYQNLPILKPYNFKNKKNSFAMVQAPPRKISDPFQNAKNFELENQSQISKIESQKSMINIQMRNYEPKILTPQDNTEQRGFRKYFQKSNQNSGQNSNQDPKPHLSKDASFQMLEEIMEINSRVESDIGDFIKKTKQRENIEKDFLARQLRVNKFNHKKFSLSNSVQNQNQGLFNKNQNNSFLPQVKQIQNQSPYLKMKGIQQ